MFLDSLSSLPLLHLLADWLARRFRHEDCQRRAAVGPQVDCNAGEGFSLLARVQVQTPCCLTRNHPLARLRQTNDGFTARAPRESQDKETRTPAVTHRAAKQNPYCQEMPAFPASGRGMKCRFGDGQHGLLPEDSRVARRWGLRRLRELYRFPLRLIFPLAPARDFVKRLAFLVRLS
jgi:hypothetical protein